MANLYPPEVALPIYGIFLFIAFVLTGLRFHTRVYTAERIGLAADDWLMAAAVITLGGITGNQFYNSLYGTGGAQVGDEDAERTALISRRADFVMVFTERFVFCFIKLSILFFYHRVFSSLKSFRIINYCFMAFIILWTALYMICDLSICGSHLDALLLPNPSKAAKHCADRALLLMTYAITSSITDFMIIALPIFYISKLQMPRRTKLATGLVFVLGGSSIVAGLLRTLWLCYAWPSGRMGWEYKPPPGSVEPTPMRIFNPTFWTMIEMYLAIWAANLLALRPLMAKLGLGRWVGTVYRRGTSAYRSDVSASHLRSNSHHERSKGGPRDSDVALVEINIDNTSNSDTSRN